MFHLNVRANSAAGKSTGTFGSHNCGLVFYKLFLMQLFEIGQYILVLHVNYGINYGNWELFLHCSTTSWNTGSLALQKTVHPSSTDIPWTCGSACGHSLRCLRCFILFWSSGQGFFFFFFASE